MSLPQELTEGIDEAPPSISPNMAVQTVAPYGEWASPIGLSTVTSKSRDISDPRVCPKSGTAYFLETRDNGQYTIFRYKDDIVDEVLPQEYYAGNNTYEYGGSTYEILNDGKVIFTHGADNTVHILDPETRKVEYLTGKDPVLRYSDFSPNLNNPWVLAFQEDHTNNTPAEIRAYIVAINYKTAEVKRIISGADFYFTPRFNSEGTKLVWIQWDRPDMAFDDSEMYWADFDAESCTISNTRIIVGKAKGLAEPQWGPDGTLWYAAETSNYRSLFRIPAGSYKSVALNMKGLESFEMGEHGLMQGSRTYTPLTADLVVGAAYDNDSQPGRTRLMGIKVVGDEGICASLADQDVGHFRGRSIARLSDKSVLVVSQGIKTAKTLRVVHILNTEWDGDGDDANTSHNHAVRKSTDIELSQSVLSYPTFQRVVSTSAPERAIHGFYWGPQNDAFAAPEDTLPPLIIDLHGGPTGAASPGLDLRVQYFTSRGYAYVKLNYTGSVGFGRQYRQSLFGNWGIIDVDDAAEFANHFREKGLVGKVGITGISAGGYGTLQCLTLHPETFDAGFCVSGISELSGFDELTHKLEMDYASLLVLKGGENQKEKAEIYKDRSALYRVDKVKSPLAFLHSRDDTVVPISQAEMMFAALKDRVDTKLIKLSGDGHSLAKPSSQKVWISEAEAWWRSHLL